MRILTRYVLAEMAKVFFVSLAGLTMMMIVVGVVREATMQNLPLGQVARLIPYILPFALTVALPVTLLFAASSVYGRMSGSNEIVAAKASGISPLTLLWPTFIAAFLISLVTVSLNDLAVSWGRNGARRVVVEAAEEIVYGMLRAQKSYSSSSFSINVQQVQDRRLIRPILSLKGKGTSPDMTITAEEAELRSDREAQTLRIILRNAILEVDDGRATIDFPGVYEREIPLHDASRAASVVTTPSCLSLRVIPEQTQEQNEEIEQLEQELAARAAYQMLCGDFDGLTSPQWETHTNHLAATRARLCRLLTEPHRRWSAGFSCFCFAWVGAPMAIRLRNQDLLTSFFLCFLPILIVYYPLMTYGVDGAKSGTLPPHAVWAGNVLLIGWGGWLLRKVMRY